MEGFTLLELLIGVVIAAVLVGIAAPSFRSIIQNQRLQSALGPVTMTVYLARSESVRAGDRITVCARASDTQCGTDWNQGMLVFRDSVIVRNEAKAVRDETDEIVRVVQPHGESDVTLFAVASTDRTAAGAYTPNFLRYEPDGRSSWQNGTFYVCDKRGNTQAHAVNISISGNIRTFARSAMKKGTAVTDIFGRDLACT